MPGKKKKPATKSQVKDLPAKKEGPKGGVTGGTINVYLKSQPKQGYSLGDTGTHEVGY